MLEKYGPNFVNNKNNGFPIDDTLIYKDINTMWNDGPKIPKTKTNYPGSRAIKQYRNK